MQGHEVRAYVVGVGELCDFEGVRAIGMVAASGISTSLSGFDGRGNGRPRPPSLPRWERQAVSYVKPLPGGQVK